MSTDEGSSVSRRRFLRTASATAGTAALAGQATAQEDGDSGGKVKPDFGGWLDGVDGGFKDMRGKDEVTVKVGADGNGGSYAFSPAGVWVDSGTKITWEWVSNTHNIRPEAQPSGAGWNGVPEIHNSGYSYSHSVGTGGIFKYFCEPHLNSGMKGAVAVGDDVPTVTIQTKEPAVIPDSVKALGVAGAGATAGTLGLAYAFIKYGGTRE